MQSRKPSQNTLRGLYPQDKCSWSRTPGEPLTITYSYEPPTVFSEEFLKSNASDIGPISPEDQALFENIHHYWSQMFNMVFTKVTHNPLLRLFSFSSAKYAGYGERFCGEDSIITSAMLGINAKPVINCRIERASTMLHEGGHSIFNLKHLFNYSFVPLEEHEIFSTTTVMNYGRQKIGSYILEPVRYMPYDILAIKQTIGLNPEMHRGDTIHYLKDHVYRSSPDQICRPVFSISDSSGTNTISAEGVPPDADVVINLQRGPLSLSEVLESYLVLTYNTFIHNVITNRGAGKGSTKLILNELNNVVDVRNTTAPVTVVTNPSEGGHDSIIGFDCDKDKIIFEADVDTLDQFKIESNQSNTTLSFGPDHTIFLKDAQIDDQCFDITLKSSISKKPETPTRVATVPHEKKIGTITTPNQQPHTTITSLFSKLPPDFTIAFEDALKNGILKSFLTNLATDGLRKYNFSDENIENFTLALQVLLLFFDELFLGAAAGLFTTRLLKYIGCDSEKSSLAGAFVSGAVKYGLKPWAITGYLGGSYLSSKLGLWAEKRVATALKLIPGKNDKKMLCDSKLLIKLQS